MNARRRTLTVGAAGGGMLAAAFLSTGVALAQPAAAAPAVPTADIFGFTPTSEEAITGSNGIAPLFQDTLGTQDFSTAAVTGTTPLAAGAFTGDVSQYTVLGGWTNTEITVAASDAATGNTAPSVGSIYDVSSFAGYTNLYTDIVGGTAAAPTYTVTDTLETPFGNVDLTPLVSSFEPSSGLAGDDFGIAALIGDPALVTDFNALVADIAAANTAGASTELANIGNLIVDAFGFGA